jgi:hypothetical protein
LRRTEPFANPETIKIALIVAFAVFLCAITCHGMELIDSEIAELKVFIAHITT